MTNTTAAEAARLETALIELVGNIVEHSRPPGEVRWGVRVQVAPDELVAHLFDDAVDLAPGVADGSEVDVWAESGRGLALAGAIVDELVHEPNHPGNAWRLRQRRTAPAT